MSVLQVKNVTFGYSHGTPFEITALDDVSFTLEKGELLGIIGHTGSGKSTLIQMLNALISPEKGEIIFDGKNINADKETAFNTRFSIGLCFQYPEYQLFEESCYKDIAFGPKNMGLDEDEIKRRVYAAAEFVGLPKELLNKSPFDLSGGQKRRCAIAGVMAMYPKILILDEPIAGLDPRGRSAIYDMIQSYRKKTGACVIIVTHSMEDIAKIADRILVMNKGKLVMQGSVDEVFSRSEELTQMGLDIPIPSKIINALKQNGLDINGGIYTVDAAANELFNFLKREGKL